jgi:hypothetical protein
MATEVITLSDLAIANAPQSRPVHADNHHQPLQQQASQSPASRQGSHNGSITASPGESNPNLQTIDDQTSRLPFRRLMLVYACLATAYFTSTLDINAVATALPVIGNSLNAGPTITWAGTAYLMGQAACQPLYGRLSDVFGRKLILMLSLGFIIFGGLLCGFAQTTTWL